MNGDLVTKVLVPLLLVQTLLARALLALQRLELLGHQLLRMLGGLQAPQLCEGFIRGLEGGSMCKDACALTIASEAAGTEAWAEVRATTSLA